MLTKVKWILHSAHFGTAVITALIVAWPLFNNNVDKIFICFAMIAFITSTMIGFLLNDINDIDRDRINKSFRPFASGLITKKMMEYSCIILGLILLFSFVYLWINSISSFFVVAYFCVYVFYNYINKISGLLKNITISIGFVFPYLFVTTQLHITRQNIFLLISTLFFFLYRELLMDVNDKNGDKKTGLMTIPVRVDDFTAHYIIMIYWLTMIIFVAIHVFAFPYNQHMINIFFAFIIILAVQNILWNNLTLKGLSMRIFLMSMWGPMFLSVFLIRV